MRHQERQYNLMVYGIERMGLKEPSREIVNRNFRLFFEPFNTEKRFNEFNGLILFQGIFERYEYKYGLEGKYLNHSYDRNELDKRKKELDLLFGNNGFACFLLHRPFVDRYSISGHYTEDFSATDLCKCVLNFPDFYRKDIDGRVTKVHSLRDEFTRFLELYGAASSYFENYNKKIDMKKIAVVGGSVVGMALFDKEIFIPSLIPENNSDRIVEYFSLLSEALTSLFNKLRIEIPPWVSQFAFEQENDLNTKKETLLEEINLINDELGRYAQYKKVLVGSGESLVESVATLLRDGFSFKIESVDEFREDLKIIDDNNDPLIFVEIKGTNSGVKREYINQTDSHRERAGLDLNFPSLLVINTHIKNSRSIDEKDQPIPEDQIKHATKIGVLIIRTLDLLYLFRHMNNGRISQKEIMDLFSHKVGWFKVDRDQWEIVE